jgi:hypothetical protein
MAIPVITAPSSPRIIAQGVAFSQTMAASNTPTSWAATGLPSGLAIDTSTGTISGTPLSAVVTSASITATNGDGTSAAVTIAFVVSATPPGNGGPFDLELDYELMTNEISVPGIDPPADGEPLFYAPRGTNRYLLLGILKRGVLQDVNPDAEAISVKIGLKELEPESLLEVTTGATTKIGSMPDDQQRYRIPFRVTPGNWGSALSDYEADAGTMISALAELQVSVGTVAELHDATLTDSAISIQGGVTSPITGDHDFLSIEEFSVATPMRLTLTLAVAGRVLQTVSLVREFDAIFTGGAFVLSNLSGATTGQGSIEGDQWRATLNLTALTGDANSIDADYSITTTNDATQTTYDWEIDMTGVAGFSGNLSDPDAGVTFSDAIILELFDVGVSQIGTAQTLDTFYSSTTAFFADIVSAWNAAAGATQLTAGSVTAINGSTLKIAAPSSTTVRKIGFEDSDPADPLLDPDASPGVIGTVTTCSVTARLEQLEDPSSIPLNLTSNQFRIGVARDLVPD